MLTSKFSASVVDRASEWCGEHCGDYTDAQLLAACEDIAALDAAEDAREARDYR